jgi:hypothetical protein
MEWNLRSKDPEKPTMEQDLPSWDSAELTTDPDQ